jgi:hypothetical protein
MERARFEPARNSAGQAIASTYRTTIGWRLPGDRFPLVPFAPAQSLVETTTTAGPGRPFHCRVRTSGRSPRAFNWYTCAPNATAAEPPPAPRLITRTITMLLPEGQSPAFQQSGRGRVLGQARARIEVNPAGVVMLCEPLDRSDRLAADGMALVCEGLQVAGAPSFPPATDQALRIAEIRILRTAEFDRLE